MVFGQCKIDCKPCHGSDPSTDTVKVDNTLLSQVSREASEQADKLQQKEQAEQEWQEQLAQERLASLQLAEQERVDAEMKQTTVEAEQKAAEEAEQAALQEQKRAAEAAKARKAAEAAAAAAQAAAAQAAAVAKSEVELAEAQAQVNEFLRVEGFKSVTAPRSRCCRTSYALHKAVEDNDVEVVRALLRCQADRSLKNSAGRTPLELAKRLNKKGSHQPILDALLL